MRESILKVQRWGNRVKSNALLVGPKVITFRGQVQERVVIRQKDVNGKNAFQKKGQKHSRTKEQAHEEYTGKKSSKSKKGE